MKTIVVLSVALLTAGLAQADIYTASMNQAHRAVNQTEAASNRDPDAQAAQSSQAPQQMDPAMAATLKNVASLRADLTSLQSTNPAIDALTNDLASGATGTKPPADKLTQLVTDLQPVVAGNPGMRAHFQQLAQYLHAVCNGSHLTPAQFQLVSDGTEKLMDGSGVSYTASVVILRDLKAVYRATQ